MKLIPTKVRTPRTTNDDALGQGMDAALTIALFFGIGFALDRWLGTTPWLMIVFTLLAAVGFFAKFKYRYDMRMAEHEAELAKRRQIGSRRSEADTRSGTAAPPGASPAASGQRHVDG
jgi:Putative F0F1-ATPase subunit Ca2+/Mg2+ transporter